MPNPDLRCGSNRAASIQREETHPRQPSPQAVLCFARCVAKNAPNNQEQSQCELANSSASPRQSNKKSKASPDKVTPQTA